MKLYVEGVDSNGNGWSRCMYVCDDEKERKKE